MDDTITIQDYSLQIYKKVLLAIHYFRIKTQSLWTEKNLTWKNKITFPENMRIKAKIKRSS